MRSTRARRRSTPGIPVDLAAGEGGVWATLVGGSALPGSEQSGRLAVLDPATGDLEGEPIEVGDRPSAVATGDGYVWVANTDGTLTQVDPDAETAPAEEPAPSAGGY